MKTILHLDSSLHSSDGASSRLAARFVGAWRAANPGAQVIHRDLAREPVPHLTAERFAAFLAAPEARTHAQRAVVAQSDALIAELERADTTVLAVPMYNFGIPSTLKAYFDHVARAGRTFRYTATGAQGLLAGRKAIVFATRGGLYAGTPRDTQAAYLRDFLGFLGITDVEFVFAEGLAMGEAPRAAAVANAERAIGRLAAPALAQAA
jgi:FMN-dependent NADH-azoreductase